MDIEVAPGDLLVFVDVPFNLRSYLSIGEKVKVENVKSNSQGIRVKLDKVPEPVSYDVINQLAWRI